MVTTAEAEVPRGLRLYAIGDVHGCLDRLEAVHRRIDADLAARPVGDWRIIHLGDYIDRGPDSRGVIERLIGRMAPGRCYCLRGNHDQFLLDVLADAGTPSLAPWLAYGGVETLASYRVSPSGALDGAGDRAAFRAALIEALPPAHVGFLLGLPHLIRFGDYAFVHAGIRPGIGLAAQTAHDLIWIREPFLSDPSEHEVVVVHGHTPERAVALCRNRIGIDTGAVFGGSLTCLVLEGRRQALLGPAGPVPLAEAAVHR